DFAAWMTLAQAIQNEQKALSTSYAAIEPVIESVEQRVNQSSHDARTAEMSSHERTNLLMEIGIAVIVASVSLLGLLIARSVSRPLSVMTKAMIELANGNFAVVLPGLGRKD